MTLVPVVVLSRMMTSDGSNHIVRAAVIGQRRGQASPARATEVDENESMTMGNDHGRTFI